MKIIDLTHEINEEMPVYPGTDKPRLECANTYERDGFKETKIIMFSHTGTHIDPPSHIFENGATLDSLDVAELVGRAIAIDLRALPDGAQITMEHLSPYRDTIDGVDFLLFNLGWDKKWGTPEYFGDYPCLSNEVIDYIVNGSYKGIGFDVIGLDPVVSPTLERHKRLFSARKIINIENLKNLDKCLGAPFTFICLPIKVKDSDGAPARAIAILDNDN